MLTSLVSLQMSLQRGCGWTKDRVHLDLQGREMVSPHTRRVNMEKRVVWIPVKALVRTEVEVEEGLDKKSIFEQAVERAYEIDGLHRLPTDDFMLDDDEIKNVHEYILDDFVEDQY